MADAASIAAKYGGVPVDAPAPDAAAIAAKFGGVAAATEPNAAPAQDADTWAATVTKLARKAGHMIAEHPAAAGALALGTAASVASGGLAAVPAMALVGLAGAGGAGAGLAASQVANRDTAPLPTVAGNVKEMASQGAQMAAGEGIGRAVVAGASAAGKAVMRQALSPTEKLAREFPELTNTAIDHALTVSQGGLDRARDLLRAAKVTANTALTDATKSGATVPISAVTDGLNATLTQIADSPDPMGNLRRVSAIEQAITKGRGATLTPVEADALKTSLQREARSFYQAVQSGSSPQLALKARAYADMASHLNEVLGDVTTQAGADGYRAANATAQQLIGARRAIERQVLKPNNNLMSSILRLGGGSVAGGALGAATGGKEGAAAGAAAGAVLSQPVNLSRLALVLSNPAVQGIVKQLPKPVIEAIASHFQGAEAQP